MKRELTDWALLLALVAMWGSAFLFNKIGVASVPPATLVAIRVVVGLVTLLALLYARGMRLPPPGRIWGVYVVMGVVGNALPFYLITWGQQVVDSALAGITMGMMPLATLVLAHFFVKGERLTVWRAGGFLLGFLGLVVLFGPAALAGMGRPDGTLVYQLAVLGGALCYAANSVLARLMVSRDFLLTATGTLVVASAVIVPVALIVDRPWTLEPTVLSLAAIVWLGVGATAVATVFYYRLISSAGPTFMSLVNYMSPALALFLGVAILGEDPGAGAYAGLALILSGIAVSRRR